MPVPRPVWLRASLVAATLGMLPGPHVHAQPTPEYAAKAAFIYNVALFSSLPRTHGTLRLCVFGRDPFGGALDGLEGRPVGEAKLTLAYPRSSSEAARQCEILFIAASEADNLSALADAAREAGTLTISDVRGAARKGAMLELFVEDKRIAFECNGALMRTANIALSSKVLRLARNVY